MEIDFTIQIELIVVSLIDAVVIQEAYQDWESKIMNQHPKASPYRLVILYTS